MAVVLSDSKLTTTTEKLTLSRNPVINRFFKEMEAPKDQGVVFLELRERLQSGLLIIRPDVDTSEVNVSSGDSALKIHVPDAIYEVKLPPKVSLVEGSCRKSPELNVDGLHVRVRLKVDQCSEAQDSAIQHLKAQRCYCFLCQSCGAMLLKDRIFRRVLPLPNGNWNTLVDDWCCHPDPFANKKLLPQQEDCLLGDTYFLLTRDSSCDQSLTSRVDSSDVNSGSNLHSGKQALGHRNVVLCKNCCAVLGEAVTTDVLKFYITEVVVRQSDDGEYTIPQNRQVLSNCIYNTPKYLLHCGNVFKSVGTNFSLEVQITTQCGCLSLQDCSSRFTVVNNFLFLILIIFLSRQQFLETALGSRLVELSSAQSIFRFSIQTPNGKAVIMLWLLNMDTLIASFSEKVISSDILVSDSDRHPNKHQSCKAVMAIKVLYLPCTHGQRDEAVDAWEKDISVHPLILPQSTCEEVLQLLSSSTETLPSSLCSMNCYQVAYLRR
ncbi:E3 ubiquitin-protein ligase E3D [Ictalurus furcatus]|uniref:E3 ubiquitin-protein ligase E3D n=1 Tax=Ictalurus furcatus TaxID=66913 RepID=UPI00234FF099|nr:E3 ubiquitin-protein ligase E3D [Ictalurus furcatus]